MVLRISVGECGTIAPAGPRGQVVGSGQIGIDRLVIRPDGVAEVDGSEVSFKSLMCRLLLGVEVRVRAARGDTKTLLQGRGG